ncbi:uncharacterized protein LOC113359834 [Papaver somniferum]|uniref:uncharacterized protein LOC113359834 n=1 Tax=Papaver somniferum TaxID=3469 RepID=UPI000E6FCF9A|nr:uncharacterized protein LOC113359834 [Papaver somniferum]
MITNDYSYWHRIISSRITETVSGITSIRQWTCPQSSFVKLNFDASFKEKTKDVGIGLILRNCAGVRDGGRCYYIKVMDPEQAEAKALLEAIIWARRKGIRKLHLKGDCENVIRALNGSLSSIKWTIRNIILDSLNLLDYFEGWLCTHVHRDINHVADTIAKYARNSSADKEWIEAIPSWLELCLQKDTFL